ncbi:MAG TPA: tetratricopeptide repeat protein, partial [Chitinophagales bacterium]|nr:tetratricopeptide repeat protein [Chitinophagales bacterium]
MTSIIKLKTSCTHDLYHRLLSAGCFLAFLSVSATAFSQTIQDAVKALWNEQPQKAKNILLHVVSKTPADAEACFRLGNIYYSLGKKDSAAFYFQKGIKPEDKVNYNFAGLGKLALDDKNESKAQEYLNKLTANGKSRDPKAYIFAGEAYFNSSLKDSSRALPLLVKAT